MARTIYLIVEKSVRLAASRCLTLRFLEAQLMRCFVDWSVQWPNHARGDSQHHQHHLSQSWSRTQDTNLYVSHFLTKLFPYWLPWVLHLAFNGILKRNREDHYPASVQRRNENIFLLGVWEIELSVERPFETKSHRHPVTQPVSHKEQGKWSWSCFHLQVDGKKCIQKCGTMKNAILG